MAEFFAPVIDWYMSHINYFTVTLLMTIESSFIPFPSEIVVPPAAWKAAEGSLNVFAVAFCGIAGSLIGALFNYFVALCFGRRLVYGFASTRLARFMLINAAAIEKAEKYYLKYGEISTFVGRLVPAIRQLISLPAGLCRMNLRKFILFTFLGSAIWNAVLAFLGYYLYSQKQLLSKYFSLIAYCGALIGILFLLYVIFSGLRAKKLSDKK